MKMKRFKRHKVKTEAAETSTSYNREQEVHDLAYYIHDRVELMHQVFSVIKYKELKAMAPACIRNISIDDLQELCTEELLGISSKRLCAILDGADPPSDTESSSPSPPPEQMETISLDSISSDEEILSQASSKKKKHKHRRHSKSKSKRKKSNDQDEGEADRSKASRAGLTVLELLELQARARAIRAQLQQEQQNKPVSEEATQEPPHSSDNEVEIKEEPAEVVEISSDDEKPKIEELQHKMTQEKDNGTQQPTKVTKRISDLVITVPQKSKQKIKLNRNKSAPVTTEKTNSAATTTNTTDTIPNVTTTKTVPQQDKPSENKKDKSRKKKKHKKTVSKDDIDNDEITLQLSDTEKMDLLEDLDRKHFDSVSSCSESSSGSSSDSEASKKDSKVEDSLKEEATPVNSKDEKEKKVISETEIVKENTEIKDSENDREDRSREEVTSIPQEDSNKKPNANSTENENINNDNEKIDTDKTVPSHKDKDEQMEIVNTENKTEITEINLETETVEDKPKDEKSSDSTIKDTCTVATKDVEEAKELKVKDSEKNLSEGEISDRESSEVEAVDLKPEVVCISDEEGGNKSKKKKKKKDKKSKKEKKSKKKSDFRESADQNFYKDKVEVKDSSQGQIENSPAIEVIDNSTLADSSLNEPSKTKNTDKLPATEIIDKVDLTAADETIDTKSVKEEQTIDKDGKRVTNSESPANALSDDDIEAVYEILELSDDSSCCEVELSKEPTALEIEALSAKIDEIDRVEVITEREIKEYEKIEEERTEDIQNISWKDRYLDSTKVKKVLNTANILNALRKKNRDLKKKLAESKKDITEETIPETEQKEVEPNILEEGSIEHYNTLEALTNYVDPVKEVSTDLKKDAKLLLKMYKKLLKYNDMNKPEDPNKKKKKKRKKVKKDTTNKEVKSVATEVNGKDKESATVNKEDSVTNKEDDLENKEERLEFKEDVLENRGVDLESTDDNLNTGDV